MDLRRVFNKNAYVYNGRFNSAYMGSVLDILKRSQHLYDRESIAKTYEYLADIVRNGPFSWGGALSVEVPEKIGDVVQHLKKAKAAKAAKVEPVKEEKAEELSK